MTITGFIRQRLADEREAGRISEEEYAAKHEILDLCGQSADLSYVTDNETGYLPGSMRELAAAIIAVMARQFADHSGYKQEWRPPWLGRAEVPS